MSSRKYYYYRRPIGNLSEPHRRPTCLIGDPSETDMLDRRPVGDWHVWLETHQRPTCLIRDRHASSETNMPHWRPTCFIGDPSETNMPRWRPIINTYLAQGWSPMRHVGLWWGMSVSNGSPIRHVGPWSGMSVSDQACRSPIRHVVLRLVSNQACRSPMGLWSGMSVSDGAPIGLHWVSNRSPIVIIFSWTPFQDIINK